jgi:hypothetical protein
MTPPDNNEMLTLLAMYAGEDTRPEPEGVPWRHSPVLPDARNTVCEICNLQLHEHYGTPSGWTIWKPGDY